MGRIFLDYRVVKGFRYHSERYGKNVRISDNFMYDGATGVKDISGDVITVRAGQVYLASAGPIVHDQLCNTGLWADGTLCTNWQASMVLHDILHSEGRWFRCRRWMIGTFLFGGGQARKNGMW